MKQRSLLKPQPNYHNTQCPTCSSLTETNSNCLVCYGSGFILPSQPSYYTNHEGGIYVRWPLSSKFMNHVFLTKQETLVRSFASRKESLLYTDQTDIALCLKPAYQQFMVHSLFWGEVAGCIDICARWDCMNGFTRMPERLSLL